jgi:hypothetical protein
MGKKKTRRYVHEHEQFNFLIRFFFSHELMTRRENVRTLWRRKKMWQMFISSFVYDRISQTTLDVMWTIENWSLKMMISFFFSSSIQVKSWTATRQNCYLRISWSILLVYSFSQLELSFAFAFIHLPTDSNGRKSNDVRLIGIVVPIYRRRREEKKN